MSLWSFQFGVEDQTKSVKISVSDFEKYFFQLDSMLLLFDKLTFPKNYFHTEKLSNYAVFKWSVDISSQMLFADGFLLEKALLLAQTTEL